MANIRRIREAVTELPTAELIQERRDAGWKIVAIEWERPSKPDEGLGEIPEEIPFGTQISPDCSHLEENSEEWEVLMEMTEMIVQDQSLTQMADTLNGRGLRTRTGSHWSPISVFNMLPRLIEVGPRMFTSPRWIERRKRLFQMASQS